MTVKIANIRKTAEVTWDAQLVGHGHDHKVKLTASKPDGTDVSTRDNLVNDGKATVTFPSDFAGDVHFKIEGPHGTDESDATVT